MAVKTSVPWHEKVASKPGLETDPSVVKRKNKLFVVVDEYAIGSGQGPDPERPQTRTGLLGPSPSNTYTKSKLVSRLNVSNVSVGAPTAQVSVQEQSKLSA